MSDPKRRDALADYLKAVSDQIAVRESVGAGATPYLLVQKAELEAALGIANSVEPVEHSVPEPFERKDLEPSVEMVVPRRPGRPRKPSDADRAAGI